MSKWDNQPLGRKHLRLFSILDSTSDEDMFTAYCDRHQNELQGAKTTVKYNNAIYQVKDPFRVYSCDDCIQSLANEKGLQEENIKISLMLNVFGKWDRGESSDDWFEYKCEVEDESNGVIMF